jgi:hypothetical protein
VKGWLPAHPRWPEPWNSVKARLPGVAQETDLLREIRGAFGVVGPRRRPGDRVLVHGDLGLHNIAIEPSTMFNYDGAAWADRHYDFRYFIFDQQQEDLLNGALEVYEAALGVRVDRHRIRLLNAACAIGFLAFRYGTQAETLSFGRTLAQDLEWVRYALRYARPGAAEAYTRQTPCWSFSMRRNSTPRLGSHMQRTGKVRPNQPDRSRPRTDTGGPWHRSRSQTFRDDRARLVILTSVGGRGRNDLLHRIRVPDTPTSG